MISLDLILFVNKIEYTKRDCVGMFFFSSGKRV